MRVVELPSLSSPRGPQIPLLRNSIMAPRINAAVEVADGTIFAAKLVVGAQTWAHNLTWTATDYNTASWGSGTITFADGSSYSIDAGNTGNISARTYVYFDKTTILKTSTTYSDAIDNDRVLLAIVDAAADTNAKCIIVAISAQGTTIDGNKVVTGKIQSTDGQTYFDLDNKRIVMNDGSTNRVVIGNV